MEDGGQEKSKAESGREKTENSLGNIDEVESGHFFSNLNRFSVVTQVNVGYFFSLLFL